MEPATYVRPLDLPACLNAVACFRPFVLVPAAANAPEPVASVYESASAAPAHETPVAEAENAAHSGWNSHGPRLPAPAELREWGALREQKEQRERKAAPHELPALLNG